MTIRLMEINKRDFRILEHDIIRNLTLYILYYINEPNYFICIKIDLTYLFCLVLRIINIAKVKSYYKYK